MSNDIVVVNVSQTQAPAPSTLQRSGALISQGGTTTAANTLTLLTQLSDLTAILATPKAIASMAWSGSVVTVTTSAAHGWTTGDTVPAVIAGVTPAGYNGSVNITVTGTTTFTYPLVSNPGAVTVQGTVILADEAELLAMGTTYFAQTNGNSVYVLELGEGTVAEGVTALSAWITNNPNTIYSYLVPREWDNQSSFLAFLVNYTAPNARTYFFVTTTVAHRAAYAGLKCVQAIVEAPSIPATEFSMAAQFAVTLNYAPSSTNKVPPLSYAFVYGVTPYPVAGNSTTFTQLNTANVGWIGTGAEGGISNTIVFYGQNADGSPFNYWYSADWANINVHLALANETINGSNNPLNPLYYNQQGITRLQNRAIQTMGSAVANGLALGNVKGTTFAAPAFTSALNSGQFAGQIVVNAEPFVAYTKENPGDYSVGLYSGLSIIYTPLRGFKQIIVDLDVSSFAS